MAELEDDIYEVEKIVKCKTVRGKKYFLIRWRGFDSKDDTWEHEVNLIDCQDVLDRYYKELNENGVKILHLRRGSPRYRRVSFPKDERPPFSKEEVCDSALPLITEVKKPLSVYNHRRSCLTWTLEVIICIFLLISCFVLTVMFSLNQ